MPAPIAIPSGCQPFGSGIVSGNEPFASAAGASRRGGDGEQEEAAQWGGRQRVSGAGLSPTVISKIRAA